MKAKTYFTILLSPMLLSGCDDQKLDAKTAKKLIIEQQQLPKVIDHQIFAGDPAQAKKMLDLGMEKEGLVTIMRTQTSKETGMPWINFTEKGKVYFLPTSKKDKKYDIQNVKVADAVFGELKGIVMGKENKASMVEYTIIYTNMTPFSRLSTNDWNKPNTRKVYFIKYDTGWRIDKQGELMFMGL
jgi:hypothetical protein